MVERILEEHPFEPFVPTNARILIMGTFPPQRKRWSMDFYYPNRSNDFWFMMGLIFLGNKDALYDRATREFRLSEIKRLLCLKGIALSDTGHRVFRQKGNASDKFLEIVEPVDLAGLLQGMPDCHTLCTTGQKAAEVLAGLTATPVPQKGESVFDAERNLRIWRMPSTSRAYPMCLEDKARYYRMMFEAAKII